jgi:predicted lipoprotein with Yx(FWY)xxD motif
MRRRTSLTLGVMIVGNFAVAFAGEAMPSSLSVRNGILTDRNGMTLYIADSDRVVNVSSCYDNCGHNWPAFNAAENERDAGDWKIITRDDGTRQWAYKGKPVYHFLLDRTPGDGKGDGIGNVWHMVRP